MTHKTFIIGHRGARGLTPSENTIASFEVAVQLGVDMIEFDIRRTADGALVCFHDEDIQGRRLDQLSYDDLLAATRAQGYEAPLLADVLRRFRGQVRFDIELKETGYEAEVIAETLSVVGREDFVMKSFHDQTVLAIKRLDATVKAGLLVGADGPRYAPGRVRELFPGFRVTACRADFVSPNVELVRLGFVRRMHGLGRPVYVWTVNDEGQMRRLLDLGVDAIITDRPDLALRLRG
jgi:glycerophosphoryl diester phosphodiesterase